MKRILLFLVLALQSACTPPQVLEATFTPPPEQSRQLTPTATKEITRSPIQPRGGLALPTVTPVAIQTTAITPISTEAQGYLETALDIMQANALNRNRIDWLQIDIAALRMAASAQVPADTYEAISFSLRSLQDEHSYLIGASEAQALKNGAQDTQNELPTAQWLAQEAVVRIILPSFFGSQQAATVYATNLQRLIAEMDSYQPCGWVVDLRQNQGGAFWPMLVGIGPVLGDGLAGYFVYPDGSLKAWYYTASKALLDDEIQLDVMEGIIYQLPQSHPLTAVLVGPNTASSGEAVAVAFRRPNARSFGQDTAGLTSAIETFELSDGAWLMLAVAVYADRGGQYYSGPFSPDEYIPPGSQGDDPSLQAALNWLLAQPECIGR